MTLLARHNLIDSDSESDDASDEAQGQQQRAEPALSMLPSLAAVIPGAYDLPQKTPPTASPAPPAAPPAKKGAAAFRKQRDALARELYELYNCLIFGSQLPADLEIKWNNRLATTAGLTHYRREVFADALLPPRYLAHIELSSKVVDTREKLQRTLAHEMCHCAGWLIDHVAKPPHGPVFKAWAQRAMTALPHLDVSTCHQYEVSSVLYCTAYA